MPDATTLKFMKSYKDMRPKASLFSDKFKLETFDTQKVTYDIERSGAPVAVAIKEISDDGRVVVLDKFTNKEIIPPVYKEFSPISVFNSQDRQFGANPYDNPNAVAYAITQVQKNLKNLEERQRAAYELQASDVLQTGTATLIDTDNNTMYTVDWKPKASHFPTVGTTAGYGALWGTTGTTIVSDLSKLSGQINTDGKMQCGDAYFGETAWLAFMSELVLDQGGVFDLRKVDQGSITPWSTTNGANLHGELVLTNTKLRLWTYDAEYEDIQTGTMTRFLDKTKVILMNDTAAAAKTAAFGLVPKFTDRDSRIKRYIPARNMTGGGMSMFIDGKTDDWGDNLFVRLSSRGVYIPKAIDTFGCMIATS